MFDENDRIFVNNPTDSPSLTLHDDEVFGSWKTAAGAHWETVASDLNSMRTPEKRSQLDELCREQSGSEKPVVTHMQNENRKGWGKYIEF